MIRPFIYCSLQTDGNLRKCFTWSFLSRIKSQSKRKHPRSKIESLLNEGVTIVCDRYSFSGVAFSGAKDGMNMEWLKGPEEGLPAPDRVIYLDIDVEVSLMFLLNITHMDRTTTHTLKHSLQKHVEDLVKRDMKKRRCRNLYEKIFKRWKLSHGLL